MSERSHGQQSGGGTLPFPGNAWRAVAHGKPAEAESLARARPADDPAAVAILARLAVDKGRYDDAIAMLRPVVSRQPLSDAALELALVLQTLGRGNEATPLLNVLYRASANDRASLARAARAAAALGDARNANALFRAASASGSNPALDTAWGLLLFEKYNYPDAVKSFQQALAADPEWAPAHAGLARTLAEDDPPAAAAEATRALEIDPHLADAELLLAQLDLDNTRWDAAKERIARVLEFNPSHLDARALAAAITYVRGSREAFDVEAKPTLTINPRFGEIYRVAAELSARNYRFDDAVALAREAVTIDPGNARAHAELGMHLMRTGDEAQARQSLERAFKIDPYDKVTFNLLALLDSLDKFVEIREGDIILKLHPAEAPVMREYAMPLAQEALKTLSAKYNFTPKGPILVEIFPRHDDFAVRTLGLPGMIGALGACFGRVVSLDSPRVEGKPPGSFSWQATLWHEMAHVITLQMSNQRIPRWLTEGISEYEETKARPDWGREMEIPFALALERGKALKLADLNSGFTRPDTIALAYYEASLLVDHIVQAYGQPKLHALVKSYGEGLEGNDAIEKRIGVTLPELQTSFDKALDARFGSIRAALRAIPGATEGGGRGRPAPTDIIALRAAAQAHPGNYESQLAYGHALAAAGDRAAFEPLEKAAALVPGAIGEESPHAVMARLAEQLGDPQRAIAEYRALLAQDHTALDAARSLAALAEKTKAQPVLMQAYERIVAIDPFDPSAHSGLGRLALATNQPQTAIREFKAALAIGPPDKAAAHCDLGEAYLLANRPADAKAAALAALEIAPSFDRAQELLLRSIKGSGAPGDRQ
ncbi:MAG TPA: tetratricopeptide repeat protein [Vicinamibacterales bacterium]|nr:tetratricopeptide repeat protein [Vicinamibacterales bacterium]